MTLRHGAALLMALLVACFSCGCEAAIQNAFEIPVDAVKYHEEYEDKLGYQQLDAEKQAAYGALYTAVTDSYQENSLLTGSEWETPVPGVRVPLPAAVRPHRAEEYSELVGFFLYDNPQFFFVNPTLHTLNYRTVFGTEYLVAISLHYDRDLQARQADSHRLDEAVEAILAQRPDTDDDYVTERYLHDRLTAGCTYDNEAAKEENRHSYLNSRNAYGALVKGKAVCSGYTRAMSLLLHRCGIPTQAVMGDNDTHVWNLVVINGNSYHLDATWNDNGDDGYHPYFNVTTKEVSQSRTIDNQLGGVRPCTATKDSFSHRSGVYLTTPDREALARQLAARLRQGEEVIELQLTAASYADCLDFLSQGQLVTQAVNRALDDAGLHELHMWDYSLFSLEEQHRLFLHRN